MYLLWIVIKSIFNLEFIYSWINKVSFVLFVLCVITLIIVIKNSIKLHIVLKTIIIIFILYGCIINILFESNQVNKIETSPSGKNTVVVLEGGFVDAIYYAYPVKAKIFYQKQNNGYVSKIDDWGGAEAAIVWLNEDKAVVTINSGFQPTDDSNKNNEIIVSFE